MNSKAVSISLFGNSMRYYVPLASNIKFINESGKYGDFDIIVNTNPDCRELLEKILAQEEISCENLIYDTTYNRNRFSRGTFWRFRQLANTDYDFVFTFEADQNINDFRFWLWNDFTHSDDKYTFFSLHEHKCHGGCMAGNFGSKPKLFKDRKKFTECLDALDNEPYCSYGDDQQFLNRFFKHCKSYTLTYTVKEAETSMPDTIDISKKIVEFDACKDICMNKNRLTNLKFYDIKTHTYALNGSKLNFDRQGLEIANDDISISNPSYSQFNDASIRKSNNTLKDMFQ